MEEKKNQQLMKKVRFDLNDEVFLIPSKWDRLSKCKTANAKIIDGFTSKHKSRTVVERRNKGKQNGQRKMPNFSSVDSGKRSLTPESNATSSDNPRPNTSPNKSGNNQRKTSRQKIEGCEITSNNRNSTPPVEARLKFHHRPPQELPKLDLVLPKIPYTPDLKKAIEKALQRSRGRHTIDSGLNSSITLSTQEKKADLLSSLPEEKVERNFQRRLSDSSIRMGDEKLNECKPINGEDSSKFSELSSINLDGWSPFSAWKSSSGAALSNQKPPIKRGRSMSSLIPSSILY